MEWLAVGAVVVIGLMVGVELSVAFVINPIADRLPDRAGLLARSDGARMLGRLMPFWYIASTLLAVGTALTRPVPAAAWTAVALLIISVIMSIVLLVPINNRSKDWTPDTAPADWREQVTRWDRWHLARLAGIVVAFVLVAVAATW